MVPYCLVAPCLATVCRTTARPLGRSPVTAIVTSPWSRLTRSSPPCSKMPTPWRSASRRPRRASERYVEETLAMSSPLTQANAMLRSGDCDSITLMGTIGTYTTSAAKRRQFWGCCRYPRKACNFYDNLTDIRLRQKTVPRWFYRLIKVAYWSIQKSRSGYIETLWVLISWHCSPNPVTSLVARSNFFPHSVLSLDVIEHRIKLLVS